MPRAAVVAVAAILALPAVTAVAHPPGVCLPVEHCETWSATYDDPDVPADRESDQYVAAVRMNATTVFTVVRSVAFATSDFRQTTATANVVAYDRTTGAVRWTARQQEGGYLSPEHAVLSPDGATLYVAGTSWETNPYESVDTRMVTTAYATDTGAMRWSATWDTGPSTDNPNGIAVAPDGSEVYVVGYNGDFVTVAYRPDGRELWSRTYGDRGELDEPVGVAVSPDGTVLAVTGYTGGITHTPDTTTVAYSLRGHGGQQLWAARYYGIDAGRSDTGNAVAADSDRFYVTGLSEGGSGDEYATLAYDQHTGAQVWVARWSGRPGGFINVATEVAVANGRVVVTGRSSAASAEDDFDAGTVAYDAATGRQLWAARFSPPRYDGYATGLGLSPDGATAYVETREDSALHLPSRLGLVAYDVATGAERWHTFLDSVAYSFDVAADGGSVAVAGVVGSATTQDGYDAMTAVFPG